MESAPSISEQGMVKALSEETDAYRLGSYPNTRGFTPSCRKSLVVWGILRLMVGREQARVDLRESPRCIECSNAGMTECRMVGS
jgi:hypothetical protein